jgi:hypothetical protein
MRSLTVSAIQYEAMSAYPHRKRALILPGPPPLPYDAFRIWKEGAEDSKWFIARVTWVEGIEGLQDRFLVSIEAITPTLVGIGEPRS